MVNKHMNTCSKALVLREMQIHIKTICFTPIRMGDKRRERNGEMPSGAQECSCIVGSSLDGAPILERNLVLLCKIKYICLSLVVLLLLVAHRILAFIGSSVTSHQGQLVIDLAYCSEKAMSPHSSALAWRIPGTGEPGGLLSMGSHRVGHD